MSNGTLLVNGRARMNPDLSDMKSIETESRVAVVRGWGRKKWGTQCLMDTGFPFGVMKKF